jgi:hypothetical protein
MMGATWGTINHAAQSWPSPKATCTLDSQLRLVSRSPAGSRLIVSARRMTARVLHGTARPGLSLRDRDGLGSSRTVLQTSIDPSARWSKSNRPTRGHKHQKCVPVEHPSSRNTNKERSLLPPRLNP